MDKIFSSGGKYIKTKICVREIITLKQEYAFTKKHCI